jgi:hypothetical protein
VPVSLCLFASTPDISNLGFMVRVLTGSIEELPARANEWGYDGIGFMPDPERVPEPAVIALLRETSFAGSASVVLVPEGDPATAARKTSAFLRGVLGGQSTAHS